MYSGIHEFLKKTGEPPVIIDTTRTQKSLSRLRYYYFNNGYFDVKVNAEHDSVSLKRGKIKYEITTNNAYILDSIKASISSRELDSLYASTKENALIKSGKQYKTADFSDEKTVFLLILEITGLITSSLLLLFLTLILLVKKTKLMLT